MNIIYKTFELKEALKVNELIVKSFDKYVGTGYSEEGIAIFKNYVRPELIIERFKEGIDYIITANDQDKVVGVIDIRNNDHISLFFVDEAYHKRGIARELFDRILEKLEVKKKGVSKITVNSSPYAVEIYKRLGFIKTGVEQERDGIRFVPMEALL